MKVNTGSEITVLECLPYYMTAAHEGQHWKWNLCTWMPPLLYDRESWRSTLEVKSLYLKSSLTIWQRLMKVKTGSEITVLECLPYYMTETHEGQHWKWNHCPWMPPYYMTGAHEGQHWKWNLCTVMPPLLCDRDSWKSTQEVKSHFLCASPSVWQKLMKVNTGRKITVLECLPYYMIVAHVGQYSNWNHCPWMHPLLYDSGSWRSTLEMKSLSLNSPLQYDSGSWRSPLEVKSLSLNASPTIWQWLMRVNTGSEITAHEYLLYYMIETHEGQHWKWNHCPWMPPLLYDSGSWRSPLEIKSLSLNASPTIWQGLMKVNTGSEITVLECLPY